MLAVIYRSSNWPASSLSSRCCERRSFAFPKTGANDCVARHVETWRYWTRLCLRVAATSSVSAGRPRSDLPTKCSPSVARMKAHRLQDGCGSSVVENESARPKGASWDKTARVLERIAATGIRCRLLIALPRAAARRAGPTRGSACGRSVGRAARARTRRILVSSVVSAAAAAQPPQLAGPVTRCAASAPPRCTGERGPPYHWAPSRDLSLRRRYERAAPGPPSWQDASEPKSRRSGKRRSNQSVWAWRSCGEPGIAGASGPRR
jgi:hypothetical protein